jgi:hypothetical protein
MSSSAIGKKKKKAAIKVDTNASSISVPADEQQVYLDIVLKQNAEMEDAIRALTAELEDATTGVLMRGSLFKWRDRSISFASSWGLRYFVLQGNKLSYFGDEHERHPRKTVELNDCIILDEGPTKNGKHHIFCVVLKGAVDKSRGPQSGALIRMSSDNEAEAQQWIHMLGKACGLLSASSSEGTSGRRSNVDNVTVSNPVMARVKSTGVLLQVCMTMTHQKSNEHCITHTTHNLLHINLQQSCHH